MKIKGDLSEESHKTKESCINDLCNQLIRGQLITAKNIAKRLDKEIIGEDLYNFIIDLINKPIIENY